MLILRSHDSGLVDDAFVCEASAVERAGGLSAIAWFIVAVDVGRGANDFFVVSLYNLFHVLCVTVHDFEDVVIKNFGKRVALVEESVY